MTILSLLTHNGKRILQNSMMMHAWKQPDWTGNAATTQPPPLPFWVLMEIKMHFLKMEVERAGFVLACPTLLPSSSATRKQIFYLNTLRWDNLKEYFQSGPILQQMNEIAFLNFSFKYSKIGKLRVVILYVCLRMRVETRHHWKYLLRLPHL